MPVNPTPVNPSSGQDSRRNFLKTSSATIAGAAITSISQASYAAGSDEIKVALIGCGGRGTGAVHNLMRNEAKGRVTLVAVADAFRSKIDKSLKTLSRMHKDKVQVTEETIFTGLDAYKKAIDAGADLIVIATPPGFKPQQFEYAAEKGKHVFMEKPVAADAPGVRRVLKANEVAKKKNLLVAVGLQRRHEARYVDNIKRLQDGAIGDINLLRVYWNGRTIWYRDKSPEQSDMAFQCNNWYHFIWTCGDQICEQHIHNLDVGCWVKGMYPVEANGMGGSQQRMGGRPDKSQIFDHTFVEYTFSDGTKMYSQGRHLAGNSYKEVAEYAHGSKGVSKIGFNIEPFGEDAIRMPGKGRGGHQIEQDHLVEALMKGETYNEGDYGAKSTFTAILGREACYSGRVLQWDDLLTKGKDYAPGIDSYTLETTPPAMKNSSGVYDIPVPGKYDPYAPLI